MERSPESLIPELRGYQMLYTVGPTTKRQADRGSKAKGEGRRMALIWE